MRSRIQSVLLPSEVGEFADEVRRIFLELGRTFGPVSLAGECSPAIDVFETDDSLTILIALPGVELEHVKVTLNTGTLVVSGERPLPPELQHAKILRMEIPYGHFERRIELPPVPFEISGRHLANGCLLLSLKKV